MEHRATSGFWQEYGSLTPDVRRRADKQFLLLKADPHHPSLQFKKIGDRQGQEVWSARVTLGCRALAFKRNYGYLWFWIGGHEAYESLIT